MSSGKLNGEMTCWSCEHVRYGELYPAPPDHCAKGHSLWKGISFRSLSECPDGSYEPGSDEE